MLVNIHSSQVLYLEREEKLTDQSNFVNDVTNFTPRQIPARAQKIRSSGNNDDDGYENVTLRVHSRCFKIYRAYSISLTSKSRKRKESRYVVQFRPPKNVEVGTFTS